MSHDTSTPAACIPTLTRPTISGPAIRRPVGGSRLEPVIDAVLRQLWLLVGAYVWLVLRAKRERPARATNRGRPRDLNP